MKTLELKKEDGTTVYCRFSTIAFSNILLDFRKQNIEVSKMFPSSEMTNDEASSYTFFLAEICPILFHRAYNAAKENKQKVDLDGACDIYDSLEKAGLMNSLFRGYIDSFRENTGLEAEATPANG